MDSLGVVVVVVVVDDPCLHSSAAHRLVGQELRHRKGGKENTVCVRMAYENRFFFFLKKKIIIILFCASF